MSSRAVAQRSIKVKHRLIPGRLAPPTVSVWYTTVLNVILPLKYHNIIPQTHVISKYLRLD